MFVNAIEESAKNRPVRTPVAAKQIKGETELRKFIHYIYFFAYIIQFYHRFCNKIFMPILIVISLLINL